LRVLRRFALEHQLITLRVQDFVYKQVLSKAAGEHRVAKFDLNSLYYEPGQKSYMREAIAYQVLQ
jgi:hypothetical protein